MFFWQSFGVVDEGFLVSLLAGVGVFFEEVEVIVMIFDDGSIRN